MTVFDFALKDLVRRKKQTALCILALSMCVAAVVFIVVLNDYLAFEAQALTDGKLGVGFVGAFYDFATLLEILGVLTGAVIAYFLISATMSERIRDIGIMKATGCITEVVFGHFVIELSIIVFSSCLLGMCFGAIFSYGYVALHNSGSSVAQLSFNPWTILAVLLVFALIFYLLGIRPIVRAIQIEPGRALAPEHTADNPSFKVGGLLQKRGFYFKFACRAFLRRQVPAISIIVCIVLAITSTTVMVAGSTVVKETIQSYVKRAVGDNIILIGHSDISDYYVSSLSPLFQPEEREAVDFLNPTYLMPRALISELLEIRGTVKLDSRLVLDTRVHEVKGTSFVGEDKKTMIFLGDDRSCEAFVQGISPGNVTNEWLIWGRMLTEADADSVVIGDSLNAAILSFPFDQKIEINEKRFNIVGVAFDPLNAGFVVYVPRKSLSAICNQTGCNLLLVQADRDAYSEVLEDVRVAVSGTGLEVVELKDSVTRYSRFLDFVWSPFALLSFLFLGATLLCLSSYMAIFIAEQERDLGIMRALGVTPRKLVSIILLQTILVALSGGGAGALLGFSVTFTFIIPEPVITSGSLVLIAGCLIFTLSFLGLSGLYPAFSTLRRSAFRTRAQAY